MTESQKPDPEPMPSFEPLGAPPMGDEAIKPAPPTRPVNSRDDDNEDDQTRAGN